MTLPAPDRRQILFGLSAAGITLAEMSSAASAGAAQATPRIDHSVHEGLQHSMQRCRFGAIHYRFVEPLRAPTALPVLCLHASPASSIGFASFLPLMGTDRLAIAPDNPGFGLSDRPPHPSTISDFAAAIWDLMDALRIARVDLVGSNTGAATAVEMARQRPKAVHRIVLDSALMFTPQDVARYETMLAGSVPTDLDSAAASIAESWKKFASKRDGLSDDVAWQLFWEMNRDPLHRGWGHDAAFAYDFPKALRELRQPILVLSLKDGMSAITERVRGFAPNVQIKDLPWSGYPFTTHAAEVAALTRAHLDG